MTTTGVTSPCCVPHHMSRKAYSTGRRQHNVIDCQCSAVLWEHFWKQVLSFWTCWWWKRCREMSDGCQSLDIVLKEDYTELIPLWSEGIWGGLTRWQDQMCEEFAPCPSINRESWLTQEFAPYLSTQHAHFHLPSCLQCLKLKEDLTGAERLPWHCTQQYPILCVLVWQCIIC